MANARRALLSVTNKTGIVDFARGLTELGFEIVSTGGTFRALREAGVAPLIEVADVTEFPEMLDGRVKTIHPRVAGGVLAVRSNPEHMSAIAAQGIAPIDLVAVNLYEFEKIAAKADATLEELIENIDIGGPTMIRAAAKNWQDVAVVTSPDDYPAVLAELKASAKLSEATHWRLAVKAFTTTAAYDRAISNRLAQVGVEPEPLPAVLDIRAPRKAALRYGENPHQAAALYGVPGVGGIANAAQLSGGELSYNNLVDLDAAWQLILEFDNPAAAITKHTNPCGLAEGETLAEAYRKALEADPISAFGGVLAFNREVDLETAEELIKLRTDAVAAPGYAADAAAALAARKNIRVLQVTSGNAGLVLKTIGGGFLAQTPDEHRLDRASVVVKTERAPTEAEWRALEFAWKAVKHVKSNAIVYAREGQLLGAGSGQTSRVDSVRFGAAKAVLPLKGSVLASDAFFPFSDGIEEAVKHGITAIIQPGGSVKDIDTIATANRLGLAMVFTGVRHFRH